MEKSNYKQGLQDDETATMMKDSDRVKVSLEFLEGGINLLDIGCNNGWFLNLCEHPDREGFDASRLMANMVKKQGYKVKVGTSWRLPYKDDSFDRVHFGQVIAHMRKDLGVLSLKEIFRVLRKHGIAVISTKVGPIFRSAIEFMKTGVITDYVMSEIHIHEWEPTELYRVINRIGFEIVDGAITQSSTDKNDHYSFIVKVTKR